MHDIKQILLVSDEIAKRDNIASRLRYSNYKIELSASGFHAIHLLEQSKISKEPFSLLLILGSTEDMPGDEVISLSRNIFSSSKELPILYLTIENDPEHKQEVVELGAKVAPYTDNFGSILEAVNILTGVKKK